VYTDTGARTLLVENTESVAYDVEVEMTYSVSGTPIATAVSDVPDLLPGQRRGVNLSPSSPLPLDRRFDYEVKVTRRQHSDETRGAEVLRRIQFGRWEGVPDLGLDVEVTNGDLATRSVAVQGLLIRGGRLAGIASGSLAELAPGQTKTVTLLTREPTPRFDRVVFTAERLLP
jgi:hypothetical protein